MATLLLSFLEKRTQETKYRIMLSSERILILFPNKVKEQTSHIKKFIEDRSLTLNSAKSFELRIRLKPCDVSNLEPVKGIPVTDSIRVGFDIDKNMTFQININDVAKKCSECV